MIYHVVNKSIANFKIFNTEKDFFRMIMAICYYRKFNQQTCLAQFIRLHKNAKSNILDKIISQSRKHYPIEIIAYCIMPTHLHLLVNELSEDSLSIFISNVLNSYARYFNVKHKRKGPLWEGRFKKVEIRTDEQLLHTTRYIHLNPVTAYLVDKPEDWPYSSYMEYISTVLKNRRICNHEHLLDILPCEYKKFVENGIVYQREIAKTKNLFIE